MENLYSKLDDVIQCIKESSEYKNVLDIKKKMDSNEELKKKINDIKLLQKKYVKSNYDSSINKDLDKLNDELLEVPIYRIYLYNLSVVNEKIEYVKDSLNDYFYDLFNEKLSKFLHVETGIFGADMKVEIYNDGPVTIYLDSEELFKKGVK